MKTSKRRLIIAFNHFLWENDIAKEWRESVKTRGFHGTNTPKDVFKKTIPYLWINSFAWRDMDKWASLSVKWGEYVNELERLS